MCVCVCVCVCVCAYLDLCAREVGVKRGVEGAHGGLVDCHHLIILIINFYQPHFIYHLFLYHYSLIFINCY